MLDPRSPVILAAAPVALLLACLGWLGLGGSGRVLAPLDEAEARLAALPSGRFAAQTPMVVTAANGQPLFVAAQPVSARLEGLSRTARRSAALLSINGGPAQWVTLGTTLEGITLSAVTSTGVVIDSAEGQKAIALGETVGGEAVAVAPGLNQPQAPRRGLEPASAPGMP